MRKEGISDADKLFDEIIEEDNMIQYHHLTYLIYTNDRTRI